MSSPVAGFDVDDFARTNFDRVWNHRDFDTLKLGYDPKFSFHGPTERDFMRSIGTILRIDGGWTAA